MLQNFWRRLTGFSAPIRLNTEQLMDRTKELRLVQGLEEFCTSMHHALQNPEYEIKQKILQLVVDRIVVDEQQLTIRHVVPTGPVKLQTGLQP